MVNNEWFLVDDKLPTHDGIYWVKTAEMKECKGFYTRSLGEFKDESNQESLEVTHWRPLNS